jgi:predicted nucleic acid-binding protein
MRVVLDTNILLASISPSSPYRIVIDKFEASAYTLCLTSEILLEYEEKLSEVFNETVAELTAAGMMLKSNVL